MKRTPDIVVLSDLHLGTFGCHATELVNYLQSIQPKKLILNGDIIDMWQFNKKYWPVEHFKVIEEILSMLLQGTKVYYLSGNHDELLRRFERPKLGNLILDDKLILKLNGETYWFFHGDVFDITMKNSKWLAKLGGKGYDLLIWFNRHINLISERLGYGKISLSKRIKNSVKKAVMFISDFETTAAEIAIEQHYQVVVCGHIHQPVIKRINTTKGSVQYMNSGDWVENLTALEYENKKWRMFNYHRDYKAVEQLQMEFKKAV